LVVTLLGAFAQAETGDRAPQFTVQTLEGESISSASLGGKVVLLQFWATWCQYCRRDQPAVDNLDRTFADKGLVVLAVDVGEQEAVVRKYLAENPRSCQIALDDGIAESFGAHGFPYYVAIDRAGNIAGTQSGSGGEGRLRQLLGRAGLSTHGAPKDGPRQNPTPVAGAKVIEAREMAAPTKTKAARKTIFVFANGERLETAQYTMDGGLLHFVGNGEQRTVALSTLNIKATVAVNRQRGVEVKIPQSRSEMTLAF
jgi:thiol-disulfide isomerase/thioredoxin